MTTPLGAEIDSLRAQLSVARSQTASDRELIVELRGALQDLLPHVFGHAQSGCKGECPICQARAQARAVLGKVAP